MTTINTYFLRLAGMFFIGISLLTTPVTAQDVDWIFHAAGISGAPLIPTVQNTIAKDASGNIFMTSSVIDSTQFGTFVIHGTLLAPGIFLNASYLAKFNSTGEVQWVQTFEGTGQLEISDIATDAEGNVLLVGHVINMVQVGAISIETNFSTGEFFLAKFNTEGEVQWVSVSDSQPGFSSAAGHSLDIGSSGDIIVSGFIDNHVIFEGIEVITGENHFLASYNTNGSINWVRTYGTVFPVRIDSDVGIDSDNNIYWVGTTATNASGDLTVFDTISFAAYNGSMFVSKFTENGDIIWLKHYGEDSLGFSDIASVNLVVDKNDNSVIISGEFTDTVIIGNTTLVEPFFFGTFLFAAKFDAAGGVQWVKQSHGVPNNVDIFDMSTNSDGEVFIACRVGSSSGLSDFILGEGLNAESFQIDGDFNGILAKYKTNGELDWLKGISGVGLSEIRAVVTTGENTAVINGIFVGQMHIGGSSLTTSPLLSSGNVFMAACNGDIASGISTQTFQEDDILIYPNPTGEEVLVEIKENFSVSKISLMNFRGQLIEQKKYSGQIVTFSVGTLASGIYFVQLQSSEGILNKKLIIR